MGARPASRSSTDMVEAPPCRNEVTLSGRVSAPAVARELPSGDALVSLRIIVRRPAPRAVGAAARPRTSRAEPPASPAVVDTIDLACWTRVLQRRALKLKAGDVITVQGALRRRFWRSPGGPASRYEVEVSALTMG